MENLTAIVSSLECYSEGNLTKCVQPAQLAQPSVCVHGSIRFVCVSFQQAAKKVTCSGERSCLIGKYMRRSSSNLSSCPAYS